MIKRFFQVSCVTIEAKYFGKILFLALWLTGIEAYAEIAVVVNKQAEINSLSLEDVKDLYLGRVRSFPNGNSAIPSLNTSKKVVDSFLMNVLDKNTSQFYSYWN